MAVDGAQIDRPARPATRAENVEPRRSGDQRGPYGRRPQHVAPGGQTAVPAVDDELCLGARAGRRSRSCLRPRRSLIPTSPHRRRWRAVVDVRAALVKIGAPTRG
jgi:hypothetical protein